MLIKGVPGGKRLLDMLYIYIYIWNTGTLGTPFISSRAFMFDRGYFFVFKVFVSILGVPVFHVFQC
jgi:hypothetical protein